MKKTYGEVFQRAFAIALAAMSADDRLLLKQRFRHQLTVEDLGALHSVHAGTISRWVAAARERLVKATRAEMMRERARDHAVLGRRGAAAAPQTVAVRLSRSGIEHHN